MGIYLPGTVGQLQNDLVLQVIDLPQPAVIGDVVPIHEGLQTKGTGAVRQQTMLMPEGTNSSCAPLREVGKALDSLVFGPVGYWLNKCHQQAIPQVSGCIPTPFSVR